jgi:hypothetical protein
MSATLTLFRPSILDPVEDEGRTQLREPGFAPDRPRSAPGDGEQPPQRREPGSAHTGVDLRVPATAPAHDRADQPTVQHDGGPTLDDLLVGVWEDLAAHQTVACPACGESMSPRYSAGPVPVGGRCQSCHTTIA